jgi:hypothetical protein
LKKLGVVGRPCCRCGRPILPGEAVDLDHNDDGVGYLGWSHSHCNRSAGAVKGNRLRGARRHAVTIVAPRPEGDPCMDRFVLGVEISADRQHVSICSAGDVGDVVVVELVRYLDGVRGAVDAVVALGVPRRRRALIGARRRDPDEIPVSPLVATVIDGHSHGASSSNRSRTPASK